MVEELLLDDRTLGESARENFIGEVIWAKYPCDCEICQKAQIEGDQLHIQIEPLDNTYSAVQHEWYRPSKTVHSKYGLLVRSLAELGIRGIKPEELEGMVFEWQYKEYQIPSGDKKFAWVPIRKVSEDEVRILRKRMERNTV